MKLKVLKNILFGVLVLALFAPLAQQLFHIPQPTLHGVFEKAEKPQLNAGSWFEGSWQEKYGEYRNATLGFRPWLVKIRNQVEYILSGNVVTSVTVGKDGYLFEEPYINAALGRDYVGRDSIISQVKKMAFIQREMKKRGKEFFVVLAPTKARFFGEKIPGSFRPSVRYFSNLEGFRMAMKYYRVEHIDFIHWYELIRHTDPNILYGRNGIHWTVYGATLAADSIAKHIYDNRKVPYQSTVEKIERSTAPRYSDQDLGDLMNLMYITAGETYTYPKMHVSPSGNQPRVLAVGDSYFWTVIESKIPAQAFAPQSRYWYYYREEYGVTGQGNKGTWIERGEATMKKAVAQNDVIFVIATEPSLKDLASGMIDDLYRALK